MSVQVWCGEEPRHVLEGECLLTLYQYLASQPEHFVVLYGLCLDPGNRIDLVVLKRHGVFLAKLVHPRDQAAGKRRGMRQTVIGDGGTDTPNPGCPNPFRQAQRGSQVWGDWCLAHAETISIGVLRSRPVDWRSVMTYVVLSPDGPAWSRLGVVYRSVQAARFPAFLEALATCTSDRISLSCQEMSDIPRLARLKQWGLAGQEKAPSCWQPPPFAVLATRGHTLSPPLLHLDALGKETITVGRDPGSDLAIADPAVAPHHARLYRWGGHWIVRDLDSASGTFVSFQGNPNAECRARGAEFVLKDNSVVRFGPAGYTFLQYQG